MLRPSINTSRPPSTVTSLYQHLVPPPTNFSSNYSTWLVICMALKHVSFLLIKLPDHVEGVSCCICLNPCCLISHVRQYQFLFVLRMLLVAMYKNEMFLRVLYLNLRWTLIGTQGRNVCKVSAQSFFVV